MNRDSLEMAGWRAAAHTALTRLLQWPRRAKQLVVLGVDVACAMLALWLAFYLRIDQLGWPVQQQGLTYAAALLFVPVFVRMGLYRAIFRYAGLSAVVAVSLAVLIYGTVFFAFLLWVRWQGVPRSVGLIQPIVFLLLAGGWRVLARFALLSAFEVGLGHAKGQLLIYGAGEAGAQAALALGVMREFHVCGFVDDDPGKVGRSLNGRPIIAPDAVPDFVARHGVTDVLLAIASLSWQRRRAIIAALQPLPVHVRSLPSMRDLALGKVSVSDFKELGIEDLLGRAPVQPDAGLLARNLAGKRVLVTGAGGSIGSELCRQIVLERPAQLVLIEHNEYGLYAIHQELLALCRQQQLGVELVPQLASIRNLRRLRGVLAAHRPQTLYHAAAYKHVPLVQGNPSEGVLNNVFGTVNVARAAIEAGVEQFVLISTDKAVRPTNVMGASKRVAELVLQALAGAREVDFSELDSEHRRGNASDSGGLHTMRTQFCMVRFGNVLGSSGSVVPLFRSQLRHGGPLTVTHAEVTRYFMTIPEAAQLVLQAGAMGGAGEVEVQIVGLRPGEKLYEELLIGDNPEPTAHPRIMKAHEQRLEWPDLLPLLVQLRAAARQADVRAIEQVFARVVSGYVHTDPKACCCTMRAAAAPTPVGMAPMAQTAGKMPAHEPHFCLPLPGARLTHTNYDN